MIAYLEFKDIFLLICKITSLLRSRLKARHATCGEECCVTSLKMAAKETIKSPGCLKYVIFSSMKDIVSGFTILPYSHYIFFYHL